MPIAIAGFVWLLSQRKNSTGADEQLPVVQDVETFATAATVVEEMVMYWLYYPTTLLPYYFRNLNPSY